MMADLPVCFCVAAVLNSCAFVMYVNGAIMAMSIARIFKIQLLREYATEK